MDKSSKIAVGANAAAGHDKINWVVSYMPILNGIKKEFEKTKPFAGMRIATSIHLEAKTAYLTKVLQAGGAEVFATGCNPLSTQDDVAAALVEDGIVVHAHHGATEEEYTQDLVDSLACHPHLMIDDGGDLTSLLHGRCREFGDCLLGGCEETTTGIHRLISRAKAGLLEFPMIDVNDADCKHLFDNRYGTGQSTLDGIMNTTNLGYTLVCLAGSIMGILGGMTIGMIQAFFNMSQAGNNIDITLLSSGIYTAMITTVGGLIVGILAYFGYNFLTTKISSLVYSMESATIELMDALGGENAELSDAKK